MCFRQGRQGAFDTRGPRKEFAAFLNPRPRFSDGRPKQFRLQSYLMHSFLGFVAGAAFIVFHGEQRIIWFPATRNIP